MNPKPLVIGYHVMWTTYGSWFPNDLRGSTSTELRNDRLIDLGDIHYGRKADQPSRAEFKRFLAGARAKLKYSWIEFAPRDFPVVASALEEVIVRERYTGYACAVMPDHVHIVIRKHKHSAEEMIHLLQSSSRLRLSAHLHLDRRHPLWTTGGHVRFIDHPNSMRTRINYVNRNPLKAHLSAQHWSFVRPYDNWPLHPGHSPHSPYAKRLRDLGRL